MVQLKSERRSLPGAKGIYEALRGQIADGAYGAYSQLPSTRALASELGVSRTTVTAAYDQLAAEGFIEVRQGSPARVAPLVGGKPERSTTRGTRRHARLSTFGARVAALDRVDRTSAGVVVDFRYGNLAPDDFPVLAWKRALVGAMMNQKMRHTYGDPRGMEDLRIALRAYLWRARTLNCSIDQIVIVNGSQQGLDLCARILLDAGDRYVGENPGYAMARQVFVATGAVEVPIDVDRDGSE